MCGKQTGLFLTVICPDDKRHGLCFRTRGGSCTASSRTPQMGLASQSKQKPKELHFLSPGAIRKHERDWEALRCVGGTLPQTAVLRGLRKHAVSPHGPQMVMRQWWAIKVRVQDEVHHLLQKGRCHLSRERSESIWHVAQISCTLLEEL